MNQAEYTTSKQLCWSFSMIRIPASWWIKWVLGKRRWSTILLIIFRDNKIVELIYWKCQHVQEMFNSVDVKNHSGYWEDSGNIVGYEVVEIHLPA